MARPAYTIVMRAENATKAVNSAPTSAHRMPAAAPPISAARQRTRVLGARRYTSVNRMLTTANGSSCRNQALTWPSHGNAEISCRDPRL